MLLLLAVTALFLAVIPTSAAPANPDSITLHTARVFQNIFEDDDMLFVISYDIAYATEPTEPDENTFQMAIYDTDGSTLIQTRKLNYY